MRRAVRRACLPLQGPQTGSSSHTSRPAAQAKTKAPALFLAATSKARSATARRGMSRCFLARRASAAARCCRLHLGGLVGPGGVWLGLEGPSLSTPSTRLSPLPMLLLMHPNKYRPWNVSRVQMRRRTHLSTRQKRELNPLRLCRVHWAVRWRQQQFIAAVALAQCCQLNLAQFHTLLPHLAPRRADI